MPIYTKKNLLISNLEIKNILNLTKTFFKKNFKIKYKKKLVNVPSKKNFLETMYGKNCIQDQRIGKKIL